MFKRSSEHNEKDIVGPQFFCFKIGEPCGLQKKLLLCIFTLSCFTLNQYFIELMYVCVCVCIHIYSFLVLVKKKKIKYRQKLKPRVKSAVIKVSIYLNEFWEIGNAFWSRLHITYIVCIPQVK